MGKQIFISYAMADSQRLHVKDIASALARKSGVDAVHCYETWSGFPKGDIIQFMEDNIQVSEIFIIFCTETSLKSENCQKERKLAIYQNKHIIPLYEDFEFVPGLCQPYKGGDISGKSVNTIVEEIYAIIGANMQEISTPLSPQEARRERIAKEQLEKERIAKEMLEKAEEEKKQKQIELQKAEEHYQNLLNQSEQQVVNENWIEAIKYETQIIELSKKYNWVTRISQAQQKVSKLFKSI
jgi:hypothetical protein